MASGCGNVGGEVKSYIFNWNKTEIYAIWVRWNKSTCSNLQLMHYISAFTDSHLMDEQNPYMERIEIHPPACRRQKNYQLTWSLPSFSISYVPISKQNQPSNIQHHPTWSNMIQHDPTWSNIPPTSNIQHHPTSSNIIQHHPTSPPTSPCFSCLPFLSLQPRSSLYSSPSLLSNPQRGHQWPMDPKNLRWTGPFTRLPPLPSGGEK